MQDEGVSGRPVRGGGCGREGDRHDVVGAPWAATARGLASL